MAVIEGTGISFSYEYEEGRRALSGINIHVEKGELVAILGHNGCGKSTLVRHFNALLPLQEGELNVAGRDVREPEKLWELRRICGMVFQNPDNQFVSSEVEEDIAFGLRNYGVAPEEIPRRVQAALAQVGMSGYEKRAPHTLSGGQKQRIALGGVLALQPEILLFDEVTSMLDPQGREEVMENILRLHRKGKTVVMITHFVEKAVWADQVYLMNKGEILARGSAREILTNAELLESAGILAPLPVRIYEDLKKAGIRLPGCPLTREELVEMLCRKAVEKACEKTAGIKTQEKVEEKC